MNNAIMDQPMTNGNGERQESTIYAAPRYPKWTKHYRLPSRQGEGWAWIWITGDGGFSTVSDYGNYGYRWSDWGPRDFREFLCGVDQWYLTSKLCPKRVFDEEDTRKSIAQHICECRREGNYTREFARNEWEHFKACDFSNECTSYEWYLHTKIDDASELIRYSIDPSVLCFYERVWPRFVEAMKDEMEAERGQ